MNYLLKTRKLEVLLRAYSFWCCCSIIVVPIFPSLLSAAPTHFPYSHSHSPPCCPCRWVLYTCSLTSPFPFFLLLLPSPLVTVNVSLISMSLVLFCSFVCFVHWIPFIGEVIWYLSFIDWLISLRIMKWNNPCSNIFVLLWKVGVPSFFLLCSIPLCMCTTVFWSTYLLIVT